jgi:hypothetical protein
MKIKKLGLHDTWFLYQHGLIHKEIIERWCLINKRDPATQDLHQDVTSVLILKWLTIVLSVIILSVVSRPVPLFNGTAWTTLLDSIVFISLASAILTWIQTLHTNPFVNAIDRLHVDGFNGVYQLHKSLNEIESKARVILQERGKLIVRREKEEGISHPATQELRERFAKSHAIFLTFGLCEENWTSYFPSTAGIVLDEV